jgi:signal transduction histidine kinase
VVVGLNVDDIDDARNVVALALLIGVPLLLVVVGVVTWRMVGRTLRPVDDMREEVERISSSELDRACRRRSRDDEVGRLARTMNRMLDRLQRAQERQRRFISDASHELRSPVAAIRQHAEVALAHPDSSNLRELADVVLAEDARLQGLVEDLLVLARLDEHARPARLDEVDLDDVVLAEAARLRSRTSLVRRHARRVDGSHPRATRGPRTARPQPHGQRDPPRARTDLARGWDIERARRPHGG